MYRTGGATGWGKATGSSWRTMSVCDHVYKRSLRVVLVGFSLLSSCWCQGRGIKCWLSCIYIGTRTTVLIFGRTISSAN
jgi:hypothetical protein